MIAKLVLKNVRHERARFVTAMLGVAAAAGDETRATARPMAQKMCEVMSVLFASSRLRMRQTLVGLGAQPTQPHPPKSAARRWSRRSRVAGFATPLSRKNTRATGR